MIHILRQNYISPLLFLVHTNNRHTESIQGFVRKNAPRDSAFFFYLFAQNDSTIQTNKQSYIFIFAAHIEYIARCLTFIECTIHKHTGLCKQVIWFFLDHHFSEKNLVASLFFFLDHRRKKSDHFIKNEKEIVRTVKRGHAHPFQFIFHFFRLFHETVFSTYIYWFWIKVGIQTRKQIILKKKKNKRTIYLLALAAPLQPVLNAFSVKT